MKSTPRRAIAVALGASSALLLVTTTPAWADGGHGGSPSGDQAQGSSNPPGNNGTVKIDDSADGGTASQAPSGKDNDPHVTCNFTVSFYGFDSSQSAQLTFTGQAPTKGSGTYKTATSWSGKPNGGGRWDATVPVSGSTLISAVFGSSQAAKQGYHVKLTVNVGDPNAPQGANVKHKVFWLKPCANGGAVAGSTQQSQQNQSSQNQSTNTENHSTNTVVSFSSLSRSGTQVAGESLSSPATVGTIAKAASVAGTSLSRSGSTTPTRVLGTSLSRAPAGTRVAATTASRTLPFTGFAGLATAGLGAGLLGLGGAMTVANRRRSRPGRR